ncbi:MAG: hypothetical protein JOZ27_09820 [Caulobacteraceae bacterium]|nr:hypothetical protein [Caulobacteraceae bacterium]
MDVVFPHKAPIAYLSTATGVPGFALVIVAAGFVVADNIGTPGQLRLELRGASDISGRDATQSTKLMK